MQIGDGSLQLHDSSTMQPPLSNLTTVTVTGAAEKQDMAQYTVTVYTSNLPAAGTDCTAYIRVHGQNGDTGKQGLQGPFARGSVKTALVEGLNVGQMLFICVGHNDEGEASFIMLFQPAPPIHPQFMCSLVHSFVCLVNCLFIHSTCKGFVCQERRQDNPLAAMQASQSMHVDVYTFGICQHIC